MTGDGKTGVHFNGKGYICPSNWPSKKGGHLTLWSKMTGCTVNEYLQHNTDHRHGIQ